MESYVDALLRRQTELSRSLTEENAELSALLILTEPAAGDETAESEPTELVRAPEKAADGSGTRATELLSELETLQTSRSRIPLLRQMLSEQRLRQTIRTQSVDPTRRSPENTTGGLTGSYRQTLVSSGIAGAPTERSMLEISRFFERDARRYG